MEFKILSNNIFENTNIFEDSPFKKKEAEKLKFHHFKSWVMILKYSEMQ